jgi:hypothetical protein
VALIDTVDTMTWKQKSLTKGGVCEGCGLVIEIGDEGWYDNTAPAKSRLRCNACGPKVHAITPGVGWYLLGVLLSSELSATSQVVPDCFPPGCEAPIGHVVFSPTGVWLLDGRRFEGPIELTPDQKESPPCLIIGGQDETEYVRLLVRQAERVSYLLEGLDLPVLPALVLVEGEWSAKDARYLVKHGPFFVESVAVTGPHSLIEQIDGDGHCTARDLTKARARLSEVAK